MSYNGRPIYYTSIRTMRIAALRKVYKQGDLVIDYSESETIDYRTIGVDKICYYREPSAAIDKKMNKMYNIKKYAMPPIKTNLELDNHNVVYIGNDIKFRNYHSSDTAEINHTGKIILIIN